MNADLCEIWRTLAIGSSGDETLSFTDIRARPTTEQTIWGRVYAGVDGAGGLHLLAPCADNAPERSDTTSRGVGIRVRELAGESGPRLYCDAFCRLPQLNGLFGSIADDFMELLRTDRGRDPFSAFQDVLEQWRTLLEREPTQTLSQEKLVGLMGELLLLRDLVAIDRSALGAWVGPLKGVHDFVSAHREVEVKTTASADGYKIHVQSLLQLESMEVPLAVHFVRLRGNAGAGVCAPELIDEILAMGVDSFKFHQLLAAEDYDVASSDSYRQRRFEVVERATFDVNAPGFPRLRSVDLRVPAGVSGVSYIADLEQVPEGPIGAEQFAALCRELATR